MAPSDLTAQQTYDKWYPSRRLIVTEHIINILAGTASIRAREQKSKAHQHTRARA